MHIETKEKIINYSATVAMVTIPVSLVVIAVCAVIGLF